MNSLACSAGFLAEAARGRGWLRAQARRMLSLYMVCRLLGARADACGLCGGRSAEAVGGGEEVLVAAHVAVGEQAEDEGEDEEADATEEDGGGVVVGTGEDEEGRDRGGAYEDKGEDGEPHLPAKVTVHEDGDEQEHGDGDIEHEQRGCVLDEYGDVVGLGGDGAKGYETEHSDKDHCDQEHEGL